MPPGAQLESNSTTSCLFTICFWKRTCISGTRKGTDRSLEWIEIDILQLQLAMAPCVCYYQGVFLFLVQLLHVRILRAVSLL